jgi:hypothetical protein
MKKLVVTRITIIDTITNYIVASREYFTSKLKCTTNSFFVLNNWTNITSTLLYSASSPTTQLVRKSCHSKYKMVSKSFIKGRFLKFESHPLHILLQPITPLLFHLGPFTPLAHHIHTSFNMNIATYHMAVETKK